MRTLIKIYTHAQSVAKITVATSIQKSISFGVVVSLYGGCVIGSRVITIDVRVELVDASKNLFLLRDNAPARDAAAVTAFLENKQLKMLPHPSCSPDLAPCNYFSSLRLRITTKGRRCDGVRDIRKAATNFLEQITQKAAQRSFGASVDRADRRIATRGMCFE